MSFEYSARCLCRVVIETVLNLRQQILGFGKSQSTEKYWTQRRRNESRSIIQCLYGFAFYYCSQANGFRKKVVLSSRWVSIFRSRKSTWRERKRAVLSNISMPYLMWPPWLSGRASLGSWSELRGANRSARKFFFGISGSKNSGASGLWYSCLRRIIEDNYRPFLGDVMYSGASLWRSCCEAADSTSDRQKRPTIRVLCFVFNSGEGNLYMVAYVQKILCPQRNPIQKWIFCCLSLFILHREFFWKVIFPVFSKGESGRSGKTECSHLLNSSCFSGGQGGGAWEVAQVMFAHRGLQSTQHDAQQAVLAQQSLMPHFSQVQHDEVHRGPAQVCVLPT